MGIAERGLRWETGCWLGAPRGLLGSSGPRKEKRAGCLRSRWEQS